MENFSYHVPVYVVTGGVGTSGATTDLGRGAIGIYDRSTFNVATSVGTGTEFFFAQGNTGGKDWYGQPVTETHKSPFFMGKDVTNMYLSRPQTIQNEEWVLGYNGALSSVGLSYEPGKAIRVKLYFHGQPIYRFFGGPKEYVVSYTPPVDCTTPCTEDDCPDGITDCLVHTQALIDAINNHVELHKFGVTAKLVNTPFTPVSTNMTKWCLSVCDNGTAFDLYAVQNEYIALGGTIVRSVRDGSTSTYTMCIADGLGTPDDFTQTGEVLLAVCQTCPSTSTITGATDTYFVTRAITPSTDLSTGSAQQAYADSIAAAYETAEAATIATADVNTGTDTITATAHGFVTGQTVLYDNGGSTTMAGLTSGNEYFVIKLTADTFKVATSLVNALAGTAINITGTGNNSQTFTPIITAIFISNNGGSATVKLVIDSGAGLVPLLADEVVLSHTLPTTCVFATPSAISWSNCGAGISGSRDLILKQINRLDCSGGDRLADITAILSGVQGIDLQSLDVVTGDNCADDYTVTQNSVDCLAEDCLTNVVTFTYDTLPAFENQAWTVVPPTITPNANRKCGIRITAGYIDPKFGNCSFTPEDYYETMPLKMEVSLLGEDDSACDTAKWPSVLQTRFGRLSRQSGEWVVRELLMKTVAYQRHVQQFSLDSREREAFDMNLLTSVDRKAMYNIYYVTYRASYGNSFRKNEQEKFTTMFCFKDGDASSTTFESAILDTLTAKSGVQMHINS